MYLHETEIPVMLKGATVPVGYRVETPDFSFTATYEVDGSVTTLVEWGDDQRGDYVAYETMEEAKQWFDTLLEAVRKKNQKSELPKPKLDLTCAVKESVEEGLKKAGRSDTPNNRIEVLNGMHKKLFSEGSTKNLPILRAIEDELVHLSVEEA